MVWHSHMRDSRGSRRRSACLPGCASGIDFEAIDDQPVDIVFLLLLPDAPNGAQLNALACVARALRNPETLQQVRDAADRGTVFRALADSGAA